MWFFCSHLCEYRFGVCSDEAVQLGELILEGFYDNVERRIVLFLDFQRDFLAAGNVDLLEKGLIEYPLYDVASVLIEGCDVTQKLEGVRQVL